MLGELCIAGDNLSLPTFPKEIYLNLSHCLLITYIASLTSSAAAMALVEAIAGKTFPIRSLHW